MFPGRNQKSEGILDFLLLCSLILKLQFRQRAVLLFKAATLQETRTLSNTPSHHAGGDATAQPGGAADGDGCEGRDHRWVG